MFPIRLDASSFDFFKHFCTDCHISMSQAFRQGMVNYCLDNSKKTKLLKKAKLAYAMERKAVFDCNYKHLLSMATMRQNIIKKIYIISNIAEKKDLLAIIAAGKEFAKEVHAKSLLTELQRIEQSIKSPILFGQLQEKGKLLRQAILANKEKRHESE